MPSVIESRTSSSSTIPSHKGGYTAAPKKHSTLFKPAALTKTPTHKLKQEDVKILPVLSTDQLQEYAGKIVSEAKESFKDRYRNCYDDKILQVSRFFETKSKSRLFDATANEVIGKIDRLHKDQQPMGATLTVKELRQTKDEIGYKSALEIAMDQVADRIEMTIPSLNPTATIK